MSAGDVVLIHWLACSRGEDRIVGPGEFRTLLYLCQNASQGHRNGKVSPPALGLHAAVFAAVPLPTHRDGERRQRLAGHGCELLIQIYALPLQSADFRHVHTRQDGKQPHFTSSAPWSGRKRCSTKLPRVTAECGAHTPASSFERKFSQPSLRASFSVCLPGPADGPMCTARLQPRISSPSGPILSSCQRSFHMPP